MNRTDKHSLLYSFLTSPKFRIGRHILLILAMGIVSTNQAAYMVFRDEIDILGNSFYLICLFALIAYMSIIYLNIYILVPKLLLHKKYVLYIIIFPLLVLSLPLLNLALEYFVRSAYNLPHKMESYTSPIIFLGKLSNSMIMVLCFLGTSVTILLKHWIMESQHVNELEKEHVQSEVDQLKEQITPDFLSKILNYTSMSVKTEPEKSSDMLMRLGQLLRYQLYDCSRDKVLLSSEINFLTNYLDLEQLYCNNFKYKITTMGDVNKIFVSPLLFIPFVQSVVSKINTQEDHPLLHLSLVVDKKDICFSYHLSDSKISLDDEFMSIKQRLEHLYKNNYMLTTTPKMVELQLNLLKA